jgi:hypothetical protein
MPFLPRGPKQRRMWVLPAPEGALDKSDRYEIGIFYELRFFYYNVAQYPVITFTSHSRPDVFISEEAGPFTAAIKGSPTRQIGDSTDKKPQIFKSLWEKNIFTSARKQSKSN